MLKVGQKVRVVDCRGGHDFEIGEEIVVERIDLVRGDSVWSFKGSNGKDFWYLSDNEVEPIEN